MQLHEGRLNTLGRLLSAMRIGKGSIKQHLADAYPLVCVATYVHGYDVVAMSCESYDM